MKCNEWFDTTIGEQLILQRGYDISKAEQIEGRIPVISSGGIKSYHNQYKEHGPGVLLGRKGSIGTVYYTEYNYWPHSTTLFVKDFRGNSPEFVYYFFLSMTEKLKNMDVGTSNPTLNRNHVHPIRVMWPSVEQQKKIAAILRSLDDKIALNNKINDNLEHQARTIYKNWFVNSQPFMTDGKLSDIAIITMGQSPNGKSYNEQGEGEVFYQGRAEFGARFPTRRLYTTEPKRMAETGDVLLSVRAPVGDINVAYERCCIGRGLAAIHSKTGNSSFLLYTMLELKSQLDVFNGEGTVFGSINRESLASMSLQIPANNLINQFEATARPMDNLIRVNYEENCRLQMIRDTLLPKLMAGEIDVEDVKI